jgi:hypothetical protein
MKKGQIKSNVFRPIDAPELVWWLVRRINTALALLEATKRRLLMPFQDG